MTHYSLANTNKDFFSVMGYVLRAMKYCTLPKSERDAYTSKVISGDYNNLIAISSGIIDRCNAIQSTDFDKLESDVKDWFWNTCNEDAYDSVSSWYEHMMAASNHNNTLMVDEVMYYLRDKYDEHVLNNMRDRIEDILANLAEQAIDGNN